jgi:hypothetical protein
MDETNSISLAELENRMSCFYDTKKVMLYLRAGGWAWCDRCAEYDQDSYHTGFDTMWDAVKDATEPYFEGNED